MRYGIALAVLALAGCSNPVIRERPVTVRTPVTVPCVGERPSRPVQLVEQTPGWDTMDHKQRDAAAAKWALDWVNYALLLEAATAGCN